MFALMAIGDLDPIDDIAEDAGKGIFIVGAKEETKLITQFSKSSIDESVELVMTDENKLDHIFADKHNLDPLVNKLGGEENTIREVLNAANGKLPASGV